MPYETLLYDVTDRIATITLNRPDRLNTIVPPMPEEFEAAVAAAVADDAVKAARDAAAITEIGRVVTGQGVVLLDEAGREIAVDRKGYTHF